MSKFSHPRKKFLVTIMIMVIGFGILSSLSFSTRNTISDRTIDRERKIQNPTQLFLKTNPSGSLESNTLPQFSSLGLPSATNGRDLFALLCGVTDYPGTDHDLQYCGNDVVDLKNFLIDEIRVPAENILTITDIAATDHGILDKIQDFSTLIEEEDYFFFSYSGHGTCGLNLQSDSISVASPHPYLNNYDEYWYVERPGALAMRVHFSYIDTEFDGYPYDGIYVGDANYLEYFNDWYFF
jgi:hypothetical protein